MTNQQTRKQPITNATGTTLVFTGKIRRCLFTGTPLKFQLAISPDGLQMASGSVDSTVVVWDGAAATGTAAGSVVSAMERVDYPTGAPMATGG
jgi:hypothetical protein